MDLEKILTAVSFLAGGGLGLKLLEYLFQKWKGDRESTDKKDQQAFRYLQVRIETVEKENRESHIHEVDCLKRVAALEARLAVLESLKE